MSTPSAASTGEATAHTSATRGPMGERDVIECLLSELVNYTSRAEGLRGLHLFIVSSRSVASTLASSVEEGAASSSVIRLLLLPHRERASRPPVDAQRAVDCRSV